MQLSEFSFLTQVVVSGKGVLSLKNQGECWHSWEKAAVDWAREGGSRENSRWRCRDGRGCAPTTQQPVPVPTVLPGNIQSGMVPGLSA